MAIDPRLLSEELNGNELASLIYMRLSAFYDNLVVEGADGRPMFNDEMIRANQDFIVDNFVNRGMDFDETVPTQILNGAAEIIAGKVNNLPRLAEEINGHPRPLSELIDMMNKKVSDNGTAPGNTIDFLFEGVTLEELQKVRSDFQSGRVRLADFQRQFGQSHDRFGEAVREISDNVIDRKVVLHPDDRQFDVKDQEYYDMILNQMFGDNYREPGALTRRPGSQLNINIHPNSVASEILLSQNQSNAFDVRNLRAALNYVAGEDLDVNGKWASEYNQFVSDAVKRFQKANGLPETGNLDSITAGKLYTQASTKLEDAINIEGGNIRAIGKRDR